MRLDSSSLIFVFMNGSINLPKFYNSHKKSLLSYMPMLL